MFRVIIAGGRDCELPTSKDGGLREMNSPEF